MMKISAALLSAVGCMGEVQSHSPIHPPQVVPAGWEMTGENTDVSGHMDVLVGLRRSNLDKLQNIFEESSTPGRPGFLVHSSWKDMGDVVRPSDAAIGGVVGMLASSSAINIQVAAHGDYIKASVPMHELEALTGSQFQTFAQASTGRKIFRIADGVSLPADVAKYVDTFTGLHGFPLDASPVLGNSSASKYVTPTVVNKAYGIDGQSVKRSGKTNIQAIGQFQGQYVSATDLSDFCKQYDATANCSIAKFVGKNQNTQPGIESMLDVEYITGIAQGITTWVYSYPNFDFCADLLTWANDVASESDHPHVVSLSYGSQKIDFCDNKTILRLSEDVQKLGAMGISVVIASGDDGSGGYSRQGPNSGNRLSPSFPASIPYALAVGSTFFESGLSGEEMATTQFGSGGGFSYDFEMPSYQSSAVQGYLAKKPQTGTKKYAANGRATPDVALLGEQFAVIFGRDQTISVGGTSASTPSWGAIISLLNEECLSASGGAKTLGFVNPLFYQNADAFNDITKGSNAIGENAKSGWTCTEGWDAATGLGTPKFTSLVEVVTKACSSSSSTVVV
jgi:tripeptidyl-peptidase-1